MPGQHHHATTGEMGGLWRFRGRAPQALVGVGFTSQGFDKNAPYYRQPGSFDPRVAFIFDGIGPDELIGNFPSLVLETGAAGSELDRYDPALGSSPNGLVLASSRPSDHSSAYQHVVEELWSSNSGPWNEGLTKADMVYVEYPNDGAVWTSASIAWCGSLSYNDYNNNVSRITENVLRRFASDDPLPKAPTPSGQP
jgi:N,N-dimethylformamidase